MTPGNEVQLQTLRPRGDLLVRSGAERVARAEDDGIAFRFEKMRELRRRRRFSGAVHADQRDDLGSVRGIGRKLRLRAGENAGKHATPDFRRRAAVQIFVRGVGPADFVENFLRRLDAEIRAVKRFLKLFD